MKPILEIQNISKKFQIGKSKLPYQTFRDSFSSFWKRNDTEDFWALKDISVDIYPGESIGIIGKNGAGKSTLLKILSKITPPTNGKIICRGRIASLLEVGTGFHAELTGRENIFLNGSILGLKKIEIKSRFDEIIDFAGIEKFIDTPLKHYSSGMQLRLAFAVAAHLDPEILIIDEVLAVGDAEFQKKCLGKMQEVSSGGRTIIFVSHNISIIKSLCQKGILLDKGLLQLSGNIDLISKEYLKINSDDNQDLLKDSVKILNKNLVIENIDINNSSVQKLYLEEGDLQVSIKIQGEIKEDLKMDIEGRLFDFNNMPLAWYSPAQIKGKTEKVKKGKFELSTIVCLPRNMNKGTYYLSITLAHPGFSVWAETTKSVEIFYAGSKTEEGRIFEYEKGAGWLFLKEND